MPWQKNGRNTSDRKERLLASDPTWYQKGGTRDRILARDGYRCQALDSMGTICGAHATDVDHIRRSQDYLGDSNLQALCTYHHRRKTSAEGNAALKAKRIPRNRPPEVHPGFKTPF